MIQNSAYNSNVLEILKSKINCNANTNEIQGLLKNADFSATMLLNLINDLLDLAKLENS